MKQMMMVLAMLLCLQAATAQVRRFERLSWKWDLPGWSTQQTAAQIVFTNYNSRPTIPLLLAVQRGNSYEGKPDAAFSEAWQRYFQLPDTFALPRFRRLYNADGDLMLTAAAEMDGPEGKGFYTMYVFCAEQFAQAVILKAENQKVFKPISYEWQDRMMEIDLANKK